MQPLCHTPSVSVRQSQPTVNKAVTARHEHDLPRLSGL